VHVYVGPDTPWGLKQGTKCEIAGKRASGYLIRVPTGGVFVVARSHVQRPKQRAN